MKIGIYDTDKDLCEQAKEIIKTYAEHTLTDIKIHIFHKKNEMILHGTLTSPLDVLFLSLDSDNRNGIDIAKEINKIAPECQIVYYSDDIKHATEIYTTVHTYFVLKTELEKRIEEIFHKILTLKQEKRRRHIFSVIGGRKVILSSEEIIYFERVKRITKIVTGFGIYEIRDKLDDLITQLPPKDFFRCHNSYIVYLPAVREITKSSFIMSNQDNIVISRKYLKEAKELFI